MNQPYEPKQQLDDLPAPAEGHAFCRQEVERLESVQAQHALELAALQASGEAQNRKLVASTLARVQKEGAIRKSLSSTRSNWPRATWHGTRCPPL